MTLSDDGVNRAIGERWVSTWHNQCPGLYCNNTADTRKPIPYPPEQMATVKEGAGGGNIRIYFCDPEGRVVYRVTGFMDADRFLDVEEIARMLLHTKAEERPRLSELFLRRWSPGFIPADGGDRAEHREKDARNVPFGEDVWKILRRTEDDIYLKGAIG